MIQNQEMGFCIHEVKARQCRRKNGFGVNRRYCRQHYLKNNMDIIINCELDGFMETSFSRFPPVFRNYVRDRIFDFSKNLISKILHRGKNEIKKI
jgi:hypothetical protein